ncbi:MAG: hypothetical protein ABIG71_02380 [Candidatus Uhrbacteria bacterium]
MAEEQERDQDLERETSKEPTINDRGSTQAAIDRTLRSVPVDHVRSPDLLMYLEKVQELREVREQGDGITARRLLSALCLMRSAARERFHRAAIALAEKREQIAEFRRDKEQYSEQIAALEKRMDEIAVVMHDDREMFAKRILEVGDAVTIDRQNSEGLMETFHGHIKRVDSDRVVVDGPEEAPGPYIVSIPQIERWNSLADNT